MSELHSIPKVYGMILIIAGLIGFIPALAFLLDQWMDNDENGWSVIMFILTVFSLAMSIAMMVVGTNIAWYHDPKDDEKTQDEVAESSEFYPKESSEGNEKD